MNTIEIGVTIDDFEFYLEVVRKKDGKGTKLQLDINHLCEILNVDFAYQFLQAVQKASKEMDGK